MKKNLTCVCVAFYSLFLYCQHAMADGEMLVTIHNEFSHMCSLNKYDEIHGSITEASPGYPFFGPHGSPRNIPANDKIDILLSQDWFYGVEVELTYTCKDEGQVVFNVSQPYISFKGETPELKVIRKNGINVQTNSIHSSSSALPVTTDIPGEIDLSLVYSPTP